jgi:hypothetical protein
MRISNVRLRNIRGIYDKREVDLNLTPPTGRMPTGR